ncbi:hypothetical protein G9A89_010548 [Geosiphon pyriformis]|nr:hypothetical protein G9A89_010548 [Geosiphon pyriformis]
MTPEEELCFRQELLDCVKLINPNNDGYVRDLLAKIPIEPFLISCKVKESMIDTAIRDRATMLNQQMGKWIIDDPNAVSILFEITNDFLTEFELEEQIYSSVSLVVNKEFILQLFNATIMSFTGTNNDCYHLEEPLFPRRVKDITPLSIYQLPNLKQLSTKLPKIDVSDEENFTKEVAKRVSMEELCELRPIVSREEIEYISSTLNENEIGNDSLFYNQLSLENFSLDHLYLEVPLMPARSSKLQNDLPRSFNEIIAFFNQENHAVIDEDRLVPEERGVRAPLEWVNQWGKIEKYLYLPKPLFYHLTYPIKYSIRSKKSLSEIIKVVTPFPEIRNAGSIDDETELRADFQNLFNLQVKGNEWKSLIFNQNLDEIGGLKFQVPELLHPLIISRTHHSGSSFTFIPNRIADLITQRVSLCSEYQPLCAFAGLKALELELHWNPIKEITTLSIEKISQVEWITEDPGGNTFDDDEKPWCDDVNEWIAAMNMEFGSIEKLERLMIRKEKFNRRTRSYLEENYQSIDDQQKFLGEKSLAVQGSTINNNGVCSQDASEIKLIPIMSAGEKVAVETGTSEIPENHQKKDSFFRTELPEITSLETGTTRNGKDHSKKGKIMRWLDSHESTKERHNSAEMLELGERANLNENLLRPSHFVDQFSATRAIDEFISLRGKMKNNLNLPNTGAKLLIPKTQRPNESSIVPASSFMKTPKAISKNHEREVPSTGSIATEHEQFITNYDFTPTSRICKDNFLHPITNSINHSESISSGFVYWPIPVTEHKYIISSRLLQNRGLVAALRSENCKVELVERDFEYLRPLLPDNESGAQHIDADLILDEKCAIVFYQLIRLSQQSSNNSPPTKEISLTLIRLQRKYPQLHLILETYNWNQKQTNQSTENETLMPYSFSLPNQKAINDLIVILACFGSTLNIIFSSSEEMSARYARLIGDASADSCANERRQGFFSGWNSRQQWESRQWMTSDESLATQIILTTTTLKEFLGMSHEDRVNLVGGWIKETSLKQFDQIIHSVLSGEEEEQINFQELNHINSDYQYQWDTEGHSSAYTQFDVEVDRNEPSKDIKEYSDFYTADNELILLDDN